MNCELQRRVATRWMLRKSREYQSPTHAQVSQLPLLVSDDRFDRAMGMAARHMGGTYNAATGIIQLPVSLAKAGDRTFPTRMEAHYRKFPCGMIIPSVDSNHPMMGAPCVSFDLIPLVPGDPRRSRIYQSFSGPLDQSKVLFGKFLGWLKIVAKTVHRYSEG